jgi:hypothetical protein
MTPIQSAIDTVPRQPLRCIGTFPVQNGNEDYPLSWDDWECDVAWAMRFLNSRNIGKGDFAVLVSTGHEAPWYGPLLDAASLLKATICPLEPARFESMRAKMFFTRFPISAVIGLDQELCAAIEQSMSLKQALGAVRSILVRPNAFKSMQVAELHAEVMAPIGPALGLPCAADPRVLHLNEAEWEVAAGADGLVMKARTERALGNDPIHIATAVEWLADSRCSCVHGHIALRLK